MIKCYVLTFVLAFAAASAGVIEVPLEYVSTESRDEDIFIPTGSMAMDITSAPEKPIDLPDLPDAKFGYGTFMLGDTQFQAAFGRERRVGRWAYSLHVASDGETVGLDIIRDSPSGASTLVLSEIREVSYRVGDKNLSCAVQFRLRESPHSTTFHVSSRSGYRGRFSVNGQDYLVKLGDSQLNGHFGDTLDFETERNRLITRCDRIVILPADQEPGWWDARAVTDYVHLEGKLYSLAIDVPNLKLTLTPVDSPLVAVKASSEIGSLEMINPDTKKSVLLLNPEEVVKVPAGSYKIMSYIVARTEPEGDVWRLAARATPETPAVKVDAAAQASLDFGEPYSVMLASTILRPDSSNMYRLEFVIAGIASEQVTSVDRISGTNTKIPMADHNRPKQPTYRIANEDGEVLAAGNFEYG